MGDAMLIPIPLKCVWVCVWFLLWISIGSHQTEWRVSLGLRVVLLNRNVTYIYIQRERERAIAYKCSPQWFNIQAMNSGSPEIIF